MGEFLLSIWTYFATNILTQPAYLIGFIVLLGYILLKRPLHECIAGFLKATVGYRDGDRNCWLWWFGQQFSTNLGWTKRTV